MKKLIPIFAIAALAGCAQQQDEASPNSQLETMLDVKSAPYTFLPNTDDSFSSIARTNAWNLTIRLDQYNKPKGTGHLLCSHFQVVIVNITPQGKYMLPYQRTVTSSEMGAASQQLTEIALPDFKTKTLRSIPEYLEDKDRPTQPYRLISKVSEVCVPRPEPRQ